MLSITKHRIFSVPVTKASTIRYITYLHTGSRVRGLKRDPNEYLKTPTGLSYNELQQQQYHDKVRSSLNLSQYGINLSNDLILQCLTHKSFAHGSKPYNEKLSLVGSQFLKYYTSVYSLRSKELLSQVNDSKFQQSINGLNFTNLGTQASKLLISKKTTSDFIKHKQLDTLIFWKKRDPLKAEQFNGEHTVFSSVLNAIVGSILMMNGPKKTAEFIEAELLDLNKDVSLVKIAKEQV